ncbi:hypothetical protein [Methylobacterium sp. CM6247]
MSQTPIIPLSTEKRKLDAEWEEAAGVMAHNLGFSPDLASLTAEHWQIVLAGVTDRMRLRGASLPVGWRRALARQVGRDDAKDQAQTVVLALAAKREEIAAHVASELGLGDLEGLSAADRTVVDQQTEETIKGCAPNADEPSDCSDADRTMRRLLSEHRALEELSTDEANARLAEEGEVFGRDDDA